MKIQESVRDLYSMIQNGNALEAFEKYYADDVVMQENETSPTVGKEANRNRENEFFSKVTEFRGMEIKSIAVGDNVAAIECFLDYTHADWGIRKYTQVSVQRWKDGKIVHERFYYGN
ncbi:ester cyclase [bacterium]|nr:ester cyclase [bacterium]